MRRQIGGVDALPDRGPIAYPWCLANSAVEGLCQQQDVPPFAEHEQEQAAVMGWIFLGALLLHAMLLLAVLGAGLIGVELEDPWRGLHEGIALAAMLTGLLVNLLVPASLAALAASMRGVERRAGLPGRFHARAVRNCRRVVPIAVGGLGLLAAAFGFGILAGSTGPGSAWSLPRLGLASLATGYQAAALAVFAAALIGQRALRLRLKAEVDRLGSLPTITADAPIAR